MRRDNTLRVWATLRECAYDERTSASAEVHEHGERWAWRVSRAGNQVSGWESVAQIRSRRRTTLRPRARLET